MMNTRMSADTFTAERETPGPGRPGFQKKLSDKGLPDRQPPFSQRVKTPLIKLHRAVQLVPHILGLGSSDSIAAAEEALKDDVS